MRKILENFLRFYLELPKRAQKIVCIGGGTGLSNLLVGLRSFNLDISAIVTMCDEGGSTGRLRKHYDVPAVGDLRKCLSALALTDPILVKLLDYRFEGKRYSNGNQLGGHSFGNLFLVALSDITGNFNKGLEEAAKLLNISGRVLPSTLANAKIWAELTGGQKVYGESNIDLGNYDNNKAIKKINLEPKDAKGYPKALAEIAQARLIVIGPGDLYTSILPNLLIGDITKAIQRSSAKKIFILNIANKPSETRNYKVEDYLKAIEKHTNGLNFDYLIVNTTQPKKLPTQLGYTLVKFKNRNQIKNVQIIAGDFTHQKNPTHHDPLKLSQVVYGLIS